MKPLHKFYTLFFCLFVILSQNVFAQTYTMGVAPATNNANITVTCGTATTLLDPGGAANYGNNQNFTVTFCSSTATPLYFDLGVLSGDLNMDSGTAGDSVSFYDGVTGRWIASLGVNDDYGFSTPSVGTTSTCVKVVFRSDAAGVDGGFTAVIKCTSPPASTCANLNPAPADNFGQAPVICNLNGYCGSTSAYYGEDAPFNFSGTGGGCPAPDGLFGGTLQNNSWLAFQAAATTVNFTFTITNGGSCNGVQAGVFGFNAATSTFSLVSPCANTTGSGMPMGTTVLAATGLTVGSIYYLMMDGNAGSVCNYTINTTAGAIVVVNAGADQTICRGSSATLTATGPTGSVFSWATLAGVVIGAGATQTVSPTTTTSYVVTATGTCASAKDTVVVRVAEITDVAPGTQTACVPATNTYTQQVIITYTNAPAGNIVVNGQSFAITSSPQTVTLTGLSSNSAPVNVTATFSGTPSCTYTENNVFTAPAACNAVSCTINAISAGAQSACVPATNTYSQDVTITYANPPASGTLIVNGQSFAITASPQTVTLTGLTATGSSVGVSANFSANPSCTVTVNGLFTAPPSCAVACAITAITAGVQTACVPATNTYTQVLSITYSNQPASGTLVVNGQSFAITSSPQSVTLTGLTANGAAVNATATFSADAACTLTVNNSFTAPASCSACPANNGTWN